VFSSDIEVKERSATSDGVANGIERVGTEVSVRDSSENGVSGVPPASLSGESNPSEGDNVLGREYSFDDDVFVGSEKDKGPRKTRRERRHKHATAKRACDGVLNLSLNYQGGAEKAARGGSFDSGSM